LIDRFYEFFTLRRRKGPTFHGPVPGGFTTTCDPSVQFINLAEREADVVNFLKCLGRILFSLTELRRTGQSEGEASSDWLPPVWGPTDWSIGVMADNGAKWFHERPRDI
jgi:hypothetical protein